MPDLQLYLKHWGMITLVGCALLCPVPLISQLSGPAGYDLHTSTDPYVSHQGDREGRVTWSTVAPVRLMPTRLASDVRAVPDPMGGAHEVRSEEEAATGRWGQPYLYSSWWFYGIVVFLSLAVLAGAFWIWIVMHRKRKAELRRVVQERTEELHREKQKTKEALALAQDQAERLKRIDDSKSRFFCTHQP